MLTQSVKKEAIIILNDLHSLAVLFILPISFMIVMTFAMSEKQIDIANKLTFTFESPDNSTYSPHLQLYMENSGLKYSSEATADASIEFKDTFDSQLLVRKDKGHLNIEFSSKLSPQSQTLLRETIKIALSKLKLHIYMEEIGDFDEDKTLKQKVTMVEKNANVDYLVNHSNKQHHQKTPTLYSIPSWLIFGIYFIVLPISTTLIKEKNNGTLLRIQTYPISSHYYFFNKALSYSILSGFQWAVLSLVGFFLVPWLTEQSFLIVENYFLFFISALLIIFAAISFALLIASLINSYEQAIVLGGGVNILLAALSGFMVPIDIMPDTMSTIAGFSPMYWSSELVKLSLYETRLMEAFPFLCYLLIFGFACLLLSLNVFKQKRRRLSWT